MQDITAKSLNADISSEDVYRSLLTKCVKKNEFSWLYISQTLILNL